MKSRTRESPVRQCYTYLKPGALAQIRNSKINAKSRFQDAQSLILLLQQNQNSVSEGSSPPPPPPAMDGLPCFNLRIRNPRPRNDNGIRRGHAMDIYSSHPTKRIQG
nr:Peptidyl-prolyl cis-trans isomerase [Ipomoea batatas]